MEFIEYLKLIGADGRSLKSKYKKKMFAEFQAFLDAKGRETAAEGLIESVNHSWGDDEGISWGDNEGIGDAPSINVGGKQLESLFGCTTQELEILSKLKKKVRVVTRLEILD